LGKKNLIVKAYTQASELGLEVWCLDEAGPYKAIPYPGHEWSIKGRPSKLPHEYIKGKPVRLLTLLRPKTGRVIGKGVERCPNTILHPWLKRKFSEILEELPPYMGIESTKERRECWEKWQEGLSVVFTLPDNLPPLRILLILDNLAGHKTPMFVLWLIEHGIMPLYTPIAGSWLNMAESVQNILKKRALSGQHPKMAEQTIGWLEEAVKGWNLRPTPFIWGGKRAERRKRRRERLKFVRGSMAKANFQAVNHYLQAG
jgi:hypothetical protein